MRLAFIANGLSYGGAEKMLAFVASELFKRGHDVAIFNTCEHSGSLQVLPQGLTVYNADVASRNRKLAYLKRLSFCIKSAKHFKPDVIVGFLAFPNLYSVITGKLLHIPSVISERADPYLANANKGVVVKSP
jgi:UDP-N-acetylglucosamine:LPS N-acetylglucosamine transferase